MKTKKFPIVHVQWRDAWASLSLYEDKEMAGLEPITLDCVGYLVRKDKECVVLSQERRVGRDCNRNLQYIPRSLVVKMRRLK